MHGFGAVHYTNGNKFEGHWENGLKHTIGKNGMGKGAPNGYGTYTTTRDNSKGDKAETHYEMYRDVELPPTYANAKKWTDS